MTSQSDENSVQLSEYHHMIIMNRAVIVNQSGTTCLQWSITGYCKDLRFANTGRRKLSRGTDYAFETIDIGMESILWPEEKIAIDQMP